MPHTGDELRARRRMRQGRQIELTALRLFVERGFDAVTAEDIADAAEISRRTFFRYFAGKDELLLGDPRRWVSQLLEALAARPADELPLRAARAALVAVSKELERDSEIPLLRAELMERDPEAFMRGRGHHVAMFADVSSALADRMGVEQADDMAPAVYSAALIMAFQVAASRWLKTGCTTPLASLVASAADLVLPLRDESARSLSPPPLPPLGRLDPYCLV